MFKFVWSLLSVKSTRKSSTYFQYYFQFKSREQKEISHSFKTKTTSSPSSLVRCHKRLRGRQREKAELDFDLVTRLYWRWSTDLYLFLFDTRPDRLIEMQDDKECYKQLIFRGELHY